MYMLETWDKANSNDSFLINLTISYITAKEHISYNKSTLLHLYNIQIKHKAIDSLL